MKTKSNIAKELATLRKMSPAELRDRYAHLYGEPSRIARRAPRGRQWLIGRTHAMAWSNRSLPYGRVSETRSHRRYTVASLMDGRRRAVLLFDHPPAARDVPRLRRRPRRIDHLPDQSPEAIVGVRVDLAVQRVGELDHLVAVVVGPRAGHGYLPGMHERPPVLHDSLHWLRKPALCAEQVEAFLKFLFAHLGLMQKPFVDRPRIVELPLACLPEYPSDNRAVPAQPA